MELLKPPPIVPVTPDDVLGDDDDRDTEGAVIL
jgi:hypothetical protein